MSSSHGHERPLGGPWLTKPVIFFSFFILVCFFLIGKRLVFGLGSVSNLNGGYPWGVWIAYDLITSTGFACGGWALAWLVYVFNRGQYHPMVRSALLASLLGYSLGGLSIMIDIGRYWNVYYFYLPWQFNTDSVLFETAFCMTLYIFVMAFEFLPAVLERFKLQKLLKVANTLMFIGISFGCLLPTMHQSSMGSLMIPAGYKLYPLWQSQELLGLLAVLTAFIMGMSIVIFEGSLVRSALKGKAPDETALFTKLVNVILFLVAAFLIVRYGEIIAHDKLQYIAKMDFYAILFIVETLWFVAAFFIFSSKQRRQDPKWLFLGAICILLGAAQWRMTYTLIAFNPGGGYSYFPSVQELLISFGFVSMEVVIYVLALKFLPILHLPSKKDDQGSHAAKAAAY